MHVPPVVSTVAATFFCLHQPVAADSLARHATRPPPL